MEKSLSVRGTTLEPSACLTDTSLHPACNQRGWNTGPYLPASFNGLHLIFLQSTHVPHQTVELISTKQVNQKKKKTHLLLYIPNWAAYGQMKKKEKNKQQKGTQKHSFYHPWQAEHGKVSKNIIQCCMQPLPRFLNFLLPHQFRKVFIAYPWPILHIVPVLLQSSWSKQQSWPAC